MRNRADKREGSYPPELLSWAPHLVAADPRKAKERTAPPWSDWGEKEGQRWKLKRSERPTGSFWKCVSFPPWRINLGAQWLGQVSHIHCFDFEVNATSPRGTHMLARSGRRESTTKNKFFKKMLLTTHPPLPPKKSQVTFSSISKHQAAHKATCSTKFVSWKNVLRLILLIKKIITVKTLSLRIHPINI